MTYGANKTSFGSSHRPFRLRVRSPPDFSRKTIRSRDEIVSQRRCCASPRCRRRRTAVRPPRRLRVGGIRDPQPDEELDPVWHFAWECPQDGGSLFGRKLDEGLDEGHPFLIAAAGENPPAGHPRVLHPVGVLKADNVAQAAHRQREDRGGAQLAAPAARVREQAHGADG